MNNQEILKYWPEDARITFTINGDGQRIYANDLDSLVNGCGKFWTVCNEKTIEFDSDSCYIDFNDDVSSLADIKRITDLEGELRSLVRGIKDLGSISYDQFPDTKTAENILKEPRT